VLLFFLTRGSFKKKWQCGWCEKTCFQQSLKSNNLLNCFLLVQNLERGTHYWRGDVTHDDGEGVDGFFDSRIQVLTSTLKFRLLLENVKVCDRYIVLGINNMLYIFFYFMHVVYICWPLKIRSISWRTFLFMKTSNVCWTNKTCNFCYILKKYILVNVTHKWFIFTNF
jgi:hypothetical protein